MAVNVLYPSGSENLLKGNFHLCTSDKGILSGTAVALVTSSYTYSGDHEFYNTSVGTAGIAVETAANISCHTGSLTGSSVTFTGVASVDGPVRHIILFQSGATPGSDDYLLADYTTGSAGEINFSTNGGDVTINWNDAGMLSLSGGC